MENRMEKWPVSSSPKCLVSVTVLGLVSRPLPLPWTLTTWYISVWLWSVKFHRNSSPQGLQRHYGGVWRWQMHFPVSVRSQCSLWHSLSLLPCRHAKRSDGHLRDQSSKLLRVPLHSCVPWFEKFRGHVWPDHASLLSHQNYDLFLLVPSQKYCQNLIHIVSFWVLIVHGFVS